MDDALADAVVDGADEPGLAAERRQQSVEEKGRRRLAVGAGDAEEVEALAGAPVERIRDLPERRPRVRYRHEDGAGGSLTLPQGTCCRRTIRGGIAVCRRTANAVWLDGIRAKHIKDSLTQEITDEMGHAQLLANRIKVLEGRIPGSQELKMTQSFMQPPKDSLDVIAVIKGVIEAEEGAIAQYKKLIELCDGVDYVTQDLCIAALGDEEQHRREFLGYLAEYESA